MTSFSEYCQETDFGALKGGMWGGSAVFNIHWRWLSWYLTVFKLRISLWSISIHLVDIKSILSDLSIYEHRAGRTGLPVRSALLKPCISVKYSGFCLAHHPRLPRIPFSPRLSMSGSAIEEIAVLFGHEDVDDLATCSVWAERTLMIEIVGQLNTDVVRL
jgi:hypothetical protein